MTYGPIGEVSPWTLLVNTSLRDSVRFFDFEKHNNLNKRKYEQKKNLSFIIHSMVILL